MQLFLIYAFIYLTCHVLASFFSPPHIRRVPECCAITAPWALSEESFRVRGQSPHPFAWLRLREGRHGVLSTVTFCFRGAMMKYQTTKRRLRRNLRVKEATIPPTKRKRKN